MPHVTVSAPRTRGHTIHWATLYDVLFALMTGGWERTPRTRIVALADLRPGAHVLDVGCGTGGLAIAAAECVGPTGTVHAVDASPQMVARARHRVARAGVAVTVEVAPVEGLPFPAGAFDVVLSSLMLHHLLEDVRAQAFAEIQRVLRPGGRLLAVDFEPPRSRMARTDSAGADGTHGGLRCADVSAADAGRRLRRRRERTDALPLAHRRPRPRARPG